MVIRGQLTVTMNNEDLKSTAEKVFGGVIETSSDPGTPFNREKQETEDRSKLAKALIYFFLSGMGAILILIPVYNLFVPINLRIDFFNALTTYSGVLGPFVGVIAGYYFKN